MQRSTQKVSLIGVWSGLRRIFRELGEFMKNQMYFAVVAAIALSVVASGCGGSKQTTVVNTNTNTTTTNNNNKTPTIVTVGGYKGYYNSTNTFCDSANNWTAPRTLDRFA
jgi:hypothetical protein